MFEVVKIQIKGGKHDGESYTIPKDYKIPDISESLLENEINLVGLNSFLRQLEKVMTILREDPLAEVIEIEDVPDWRRSLDL
jgi:hypothetical protein